MASFTSKELAFIFGIIGNIISFLNSNRTIILRASYECRPTFYTIWKKKSSKSFQSIPYSVAFFSASLLLYYGFLKTNAYMIVSINGIGCVIEAIYLVIYLIYAPNKAKVRKYIFAIILFILQIFTMKLIIVFNVGGLGLITGVSLVAFKGVKRVSFVGWVCAIFTIAVFAAPLSIMVKFHN
ncbi:PREDICTED: bidirectional sugar transporter SWEET9-like [Erythranthe guttata]|uniref:bidirectional sugar transporter SWEET9-like n=1 Tax=Erythranthe guttata TaxID=4155 RepID=UPI00064DDF70|nr:PREDICTED: bidirectional sugar transporter SWEET9-like [Erythranthe guttata]|eukprot:XP_012841128.1 PREDICTED: bidirectional sugar transporter SWEET9-like [Erythranthe guttata]